MLDYFSPPSTEPFRVPMAVPQPDPTPQRDFDWYSSPSSVVSLQDQIRRSVLAASDGKFKIGPQDPVQLRIIMFKVYDEHRVFEGGIPEFHAMVLPIVTNNVLTNIYDSLYYRQNIDTVSMRSTNWQTGIQDYPARVDQKRKGDSLMFKMR